jgi:oligosaccharide repeat unit polymerase
MEDNKLIYFSIVISFLILATAYLRARTAASPSVLFPLLWMSILIIHSSGMYGIKLVDNKILSIIITGEFAFAVGSVLANRANFRIVIGKFDSQKNKVANTPVIKWMTIAFYLIMILPTVKAIGLLFSGNSLYSIRYALQNNILGDGVISILFNYFCEPYLVSLIVISVANLFSDHRQVSLSVITIIGIIVMTVVTGGRFFILYYLGSLIMCYLVYRKKIRSVRRNSSKLLRRTRLLIVAALFAILVVSIVRGSAIGQTLYVYSSGGLSFMERLLEKYNENTTSYTYGSLTLNGLLRPLFVVLRKIGIASLPKFLQTAEEIFLYVDKPFYISNLILFNSFTTCFFAPYIDGGYIGVVIVFLFLGYVCESKYKNIELDYTYSVSQYLLWGLVIILSFFRLLITHYSFALAILYMLVLFNTNTEEAANSYGK